MNNDKSQSLSMLIYDDLVNEIYLQLIVSGLQSLVSVVQVSVLPIYNISQSIVVLLQRVLLSVQPAK